MSTNHSGLFAHVRGQAPLQVGARSLTPLAFDAGVRLPWRGWVWSFPVAVKVEEAGRRTILPIVDVTRIAIIAIIKLALLIVGLRWLAQRKAAPDSVANYEML